ncbi:MAG: DUF373 family protein [Candidatus Micrarchaeota archaeon]|nr:DUF373 family protein [Candidatus Micrarchaeota archaeon]MDE1833790.1 DUF373 family protein [Candidatus Micrarchaeota archaeon]MDE1859961.1 DUF373 family protein [Candidatus Micrarchaeota archaeon]
MPRSSSASIRKKDERILVLVVDIDNDLYRKTRIAGPLIGRAPNLDGAGQLALADPEDPDANTMFYAVRTYDKLRKEGYLVNIATVTGAESEGYAADSEVARQLELVLESNKSDVCMLVSDGASDQRIIPIIESRLKINSIQIVTMKQAESLENTYFTVLEKLKEPHYARIVFGLPAVLLLLFAVSYSIGTGWVLPVGLIGLYLLIKGFGLEDAFLNSFRGFGFSIDRMSFVFYFSSLLFLAAGVFISAGNYTTTLRVVGDQGAAIAQGIEGFLIVLPMFFLLFIIGRLIDIRSTKHMFKTFRYGVYFGSMITLWVLMYSFTAWLIGQIYFGQLLEYTLIAIAIGVSVSYFANFLRRRVIASKDMKDKPVVNELGANIGKISKVDVKRGRIIINTSFGNPVTYGVDRIVEISDRVMIR